MSRHEPSALEVSALAVCYPSTAAYSTPVQVITDLEFQLRVGDVMTIIGESGCGKSTLLAALARLVPTSDGRMRLFGEDYTHCGYAHMRRLRRLLQLMLQDSAGTFDQRMTLGQTIYAPMRWLRAEWTNKEWRFSLENALYISGLDRKLLDRKASECSGGQLKRAALARALVAQPTVLLLDEPFAGLDAESRRIIASRLWEEYAKRPMAILMASHQTPPADWILTQVMDLSEGRLTESSLVSD